MKQFYHNFKFHASGLTHRINTRSSKLQSFSGNLAKSCFGLFCLFSLASFGQATTDKEWKLLRSDDNVTFYYQINNCDNQEAIYLKVVNSNPKQVRVEWKIVVKSEGQKKADQFSGVYSNFGADKTITGECGSISKGGLVYKLNHNANNADIQSYPKVTQLYNKEMNKINIKSGFVFLTGLFFWLTSLNSVYGQTASVILNWTGGHCVVCEGDYACSSGYGEWN